MVQRRARAQAAVRRTTSLEAWARARWRLAYPALDELTQNALEELPHPALEDIAQHALEELLQPALEALDDLAQPDD